MPHLPDWSTLLRLAALGVPLSFALGAALLARADPLRRAGHAAALAATLAALVGAGAAVAPPGAAGVGAARWVRLDAVTGVMLALVCTLAVVTIRYSRTYLAADPGRARYARALLLTLAAVTLLVLANNLLVIALAWTATSLALHALLTHFSARPRALAAAHKKFLLSRLADACTLGAVALIAQTVGALDLDAINAFARTPGPLPPALTAAAVLLAVAVSLKSAQLPFHGWITQVMEAPTPVSALLHAGVVNIGGFVLLRLAPLIERAPIAQTLLVVVGTATAVVAALVMTTRVSVKVALAWSTSAQLGFMLVECGLGAWHLALLHLVAHSLYKAHAFLSAGSAVEVWRVRAITIALAPSPRATLVAAGATLAAGIASGVGLGALAPGDPARAFAAALLCLSLAPLVARGAALRAAVTAAFYVASHVAFAHLFALPHPAGAAPFRLTVAVGGFTLLFFAQTALQAWPQGRLARALQPMLFAGLYLDERFTRLTFQLWPPRRLPPSDPTYAPLLAAIREH